MIKTRLVGIGVFCIMAFACFYLFKELRDARSEIRRISKSFEASTKNLDYYKSENGKLVAKLEVMQLNNNELGRIFPEILAEIKQLKVNPRQVNHYSETVIRQEKEVVRELRDSIIHDTIRVRGFNYSDEFYKVNGHIRDDLVRMNISSTDSIIQVVYRGKRERPWLWILSPRKLEQVISSKNPSSKIIYSKSINISK